MHLKTYALGWSLEVHYRKCNNKCHSINTYPYSQMKLFILFGNALGNSFFCFFVAWIRNRTETHLVIFLFLGIDLEQKQKTKNKLFFYSREQLKKQVFSFFFLLFLFLPFFFPLVDRQPRWWLATNQTSLANSPDPRQPPARSPRVCQPPMRPPEPRCGWVRSRARSTSQ